MFGFFAKKSPLSRLLKEFDALGADYLTHANMEYGGGREGEVFTKVLALREPGLFKEAVEMLLGAPAARRKQLSYILRVIAGQQQDAVLLQQLVGLYYAEADDGVATHIQQLLTRSTIGSSSINIMSPVLDLQPPAGAGIQGDLRYLDLITISLGLNWALVLRGEVNHLDFTALAEHMLQLHDAPEAAASFFRTPAVMARVGARADNTAIEQLLLAKLENASTAGEQLQLASALAKHYPLSAASPVTAHLLTLSEKRNSQHEAVEALGYAPCAEVEERLIELLQSDKTSADLLTGVLRSVGQTNSVKARPFVIELLEHPARDVRWAALQALPVDEEYLPCWINRLEKDRDPFLKGFALTGLLGNNSALVQEAVLRFARKAAKQKDGKQLTMAAYLHPAASYLSRFQDNKEAREFLNTLPADFLSGEATVEAKLTAGLHTGPDR